MGNGMLSQEEIDALLNGTLGADNSPPIEPQTPDFSDVEKDAIGEICNISMGTAATTLSQLLGKKVEITTPVVKISTLESISEEYPIPSVIVDVKYKAGIEGSNFLILSQTDGGVIVDLMMGGDGHPSSPELTELAISGISEAMNQMMGSAATSMSTMFHSMVDITPPQLALLNLNDKSSVIGGFLPENEQLISVSFRMVVEDVIDSSLIQVIPIPVAKGMVEKLMASMGQESAASAPQPSSAPHVHPQIQPQTMTPSQPEPQVSHPGLNPTAQQSTPEYAPQYAPQPQYDAQPQKAANSYSTTSVQPAQFAPLKPAPIHIEQDNLDLIMDVPLQVTVELGKAKKTIKEILEMGPGSVLELDRLAGEPVDMLVNGKLVAKCEVVVINESFGIRITEIIQPSERMPNRNMKK